MLQRSGTTRGGAAGVQRIWSKASLHRRLAQWSSATVSSSASRSRMRPQSSLIKAEVVRCTGPNAIAPQAPA